MKISYFIILLALISVVPAHAGTEQGAHLFILSGQSNMVRLDHEESFVPAVRKEFGKENVLVVKDAQGGQPIRRWYKQWEVPKRMMGEPSGKPAQYAEEKKAEASSGKKRKKKVEPISNGDLYERLLAAVLPTIEGKRIQSVTFIWMQGEADAKAGYGEVYRASLKGLIEQLKQDLGRSNLNVVIGRLSDAGMDNGRFPHWTMIRDIQVDLAETLPRAAWVNTDDLNTGIHKGKEMVDGVHYSVEGYKILGQRFAEKAIELVNQTISTLPTEEAL